MRRTVLLTAVAAVAVIAAPASAAPTFSSVAGTAASYAAPAGSTTVINFNGTTGNGVSVAPEAAAKGFTATATGVSGIFNAAGNVTNFNGSGNGFFRPEPSDGTGYYGIGGNGSLTLLGNVANNSISVFIGSMDNYNVVSLLDVAGNTIRSFTGEEIFGQSLPFPGGTSPETNRRVTFTGAPIYGVSFSNKNNMGSFEFDNVAFAAVPEPATWAMMLVGFGGIGFAMRRRKSVKTTVQFA